MVKKKPEKVGEKVGEKSEEAAVSKEDVSKRLLRSSEHDSFDLEVEARRDAEARWKKSLVETMSVEEAKKRAMVRFARAERAASQAFHVARVTMPTLARDEARERFEWARARDAEERALRERAFRETEDRAVEVARRRAFEEAERATIEADIERRLGLAFEEAEKLERQAKLEEDMLRRRDDSKKTTCFVKRRPKKKDPAPQETQEQEKENPLNNEPAAYVSAMPSKRLTKAVMRQPEHMALWKREQRLAAVLEAQRQSKRRRMALFMQLDALKERKAEHGRRRLQRDAIEIGSRAEARRQRGEDIKRAKERAEAATSALEAAEKAADAAKAAAKRALACAQSASSKLARIDRNKRKRDDKLASAAANRALRVEAEVAISAAKAALAILDCPPLEVTLVYGEEVVALKMPGHKWATRPAWKLIDTFKAHYNSKKKQTEKILPPLLALATYVVLLIVIHSFIHSLLGLTACPSTPVAYRMPSPSAAASSRSSLFEETNCQQWRARKLFL